MLYAFAEGAFSSWAVIYLREAKALPTGVAAILAQDPNIESFMRRALTINEQSFGSDHPNVACALNSLALLLKDTNRLTEAEPLMRRALGIVLDFTRRTGYEHPHLRIVQGNYATILKGLGRSEADIDAELRNLRAEFGSREA